jgi:hypothetical protein
VAMKCKVPINPRVLSATLHGMTRSDHVRARAIAKEHADRESGAEDFEARGSFSGGGSDKELKEYRPTFDPFSTRDAMAEKVEHDECFLALPPSSSLGGRHIHESHMLSPLIPGHHLSCFPC